MYWGIPGCSPVPDPNNTHARIASISLAIASHLRWSVVTAVEARYDAYPHVELFWRTLRAIPMEPTSVFLHTPTSSQTPVAEI